MSSNQQSQQNNQEKEVYFIILTPGEEKVDFNKVFKSQNVPKSIYKKSIEKGKGYFLEHNVFKINIVKKEDKDIEEKYIIKYIVGDDSYDIILSLKDNSFIYNPKLLKGNKYLHNIVKDEIDQTIIPLYYKLDIFLEALNETNEKNK